MPSTGRRTDSSWGRMAVWNPWIYDTGWYWQLYHTDDLQTGNLLGLFAGRASRAVGAADCGTGIFTLPPASVGEVPRAGFNLNRLHNLQLDFPDPAQGYGSLYMDPSVVQRMIARVREDDEYCRYLFNQSTHSRNREIVTLWADPSGRLAREGAQSLTEATAGRVQTLVHGNGFYDFGLHYWEGGTGMISSVELGAQLLATGFLDPAGIAKVKAAMVVNAALLYDDDHTPLTAAHGLNLGNPNMPVMQNGFRQQATLHLATHPMMASRLPQLAEGARGLLADSIAESGAHQSAVGYITTSQPHFATLLALQNHGLYDAFREEPRLTRFAHFYLNLMTPPEYRFGGLRKMLPTGDSSADGSALMGYLATGRPARASAWIVPTSPATWQRER